MAKNKAGKTANHHAQMKRGQEKRDNARRRFMFQCPFAKNCAKGWGCGPACPRINGGV